MGSLDRGVVVSGGLDWRVVATVLGVLDVVTSMSSSVGDSVAHVSVSGVGSGLDDLGWLLDHGGESSGVGELLDLLDGLHLESLDLGLSVEKGSDVLVLLTDLDQFADDGSGLDGEFRNGDLELFDDGNKFSVESGGSGVLLLEVGEIAGQFGCVSVDQSEFLFQGVDLVVESSVSGQLFVVEILLSLELSDQGLVLGFSGIELGFEVGNVGVELVDSGFSLHDGVSHVHDGGSEVLKLGDSLLQLGGEGVSLSVEISESDFVVSGSLGFLGQLVFDGGTLVEQVLLFTLQELELGFQSVELGVESISISFENSDFVVKFSDLLLGFVELSSESRDFLVESIGVDSLLLVSLVDVVEFSVKHVDFVDLAFFFGLALGLEAVEVVEKVEVVSFGGLESLEDRVVVSLTLSHLEKLSLELGDDNILVVGFNLFWAEISLIC